MELLNLGKLPAFEGVSKHFAENLAHYRKYFDSSDPHRDPLAGEWNTKLSQFQKMLYLRCIRVDKALLAVTVCSFIYTNLKNSINRFYFLMIVYVYMCMCARMRATLILCAFKYVVNFNL